MLSEVDTKLFLLKNNILIVNNPIDTANMIAIWCLVKIEISNNRINKIINAGFFCFNINIDKKDIIIPIMIRIIPRIVLKNDRGPIRGITIRLPAPDIFDKVSLKVLKAGSETIPWNNK